MGEKYQRTFFGFFFCVFLFFVSLVRAEVEAIDAKIYEREAVKGEERKERIVESRKEKEGVGDIARGEEKAGEEAYQFIGTHFFASFSGCDEKAIMDVVKLKEMMLQATKAARATVLDSSSYIFPGNGFTMVILLSESHATIHTYPEHQSCFIDFFTCGTKCSSEKFNQFLQSYLKPKKVVFRTFIRDEEIVEKKG